MFASHLKKTIGFTADNGSEKGNLEAERLAGRPSSQEFMVTVGSWQYRCREVG